MALLRVLEDAKIQVDRARYKLGNMLNPDSYGGFVRDAKNDLYFAAERIREAIAEVKNAPPAL